MEFCFPAILSSGDFFLTKLVISFRPESGYFRPARTVGAFPDGNSALMLVCARLRHVAGTQWGCKKYMNMKHLEAMERELLAG